MSVIAEESKTEQMLGKENMMVSTNDKNGYVESIVNLGFDSYNWSKQKALESKVLAPTLKPSLEFVEDALTKANERAPYTYDQVVSAIDSKIDVTLKYSQETIEQVGKGPKQLKNATLGAVHRNLEKLTEAEAKAQAEAESKIADAESEHSFVEIVNDVAEITSLGANKVLDVSERVVERLLPKKEDEPEDDLEVSESSFLQKNKSAYRALKLSKVVTKRMQRRALGQLNTLQLRTKSVVHVDLVKYSEMLDMDAKKVWLSEKSDDIKTGLDKKVVEPLKKLGGSVNLPHSYGDLKEVAQKYQEAARARVVHIKVPFSDDIIRIWTVVGDECNQKIVQPCEQIVETFKQELKKQQEIVQKQEADPSKPLTIEAGLRAVVAAARFRLKKEYELRVAPTMETVMAKTPFAKKSGEKSAAPEADFKVGSEYDESDESNEPLFDAQD